MAPLLQQAASAVLGGVATPFSYAAGTFGPQKNAKLEARKAGAAAYNPAAAVAAAMSSGGGASASAGAPVVAAAPAEPIKLYSAQYYTTCAVGGIIACGSTHMAVTPLDVVKCNMQTNPAKYPSIAGGFGTIVREQGAAGLFRGWLPTLLGYSAQGAFKFGLYEYFKKTYADAAGAETAAKYQTPLFLAASASAEFFADMALAPFEAVKVAVQTRPGFAKGLSDGMPKLVAADGVGTLFKSLPALWGRQIPYTMVKFGAFENVVTGLYKYAVPKPRDECTKGEQVGVSFAAGYIAGVFCAVVSHPADNLVSKLNAQKGASAGDIVREMGWAALFTRGLPLRIVMIGTLTGLQWGIYDAYKVYAGLPATGSVAKK